VRECQRRGIRLNYAAHVTGHGWRKLMRLEEPFVYEITAPRPHPAIFRFLMEAGPVAPREAYATFNMGIGFAVYVSPGLGRARRSRRPAHGLRRLGRRARAQGRQAQGRFNPVARPRIRGRHAAGEVTAPGCV
jgi:phosphoribosylformylglycinamidine cyclo-ligase